MGDLGKGDLKDMVRTMEEKLESLRSNSVKKYNIQRGFAKIRQGRRIAKKIRFHYRTRSGCPSQKMSFLKGGKGAVRGEVYYRGNTKRLVRGETSKKAD